MITNPHCRTIAVRLTLGLTLIAVSLLAPVFATLHAQNAIDLTPWTAESYQAVSGFNPGIWEVAPDGQSVLQTVNGQPTLFISDFDVVGSDVEGVISVQTAGDDDYVGFAIGYQPGDALNTNADYLLLDWKQGTQTFNFGVPSCSSGTTAPEGLALSRVTGIPNADEFWGHVDFDDVCSPLGQGLEELQRGTNFGDAGWDPFTEYRFRIVLTADRVQVFVNDVLEIDVLGSFADGRMGFYNFSQANVAYSGFELSPAGQFLRGDVDNDTVLSATDEAAILDWMFDSGVEPVDCLGETFVETADTNDNEWVTIADYLTLRNAILGLPTLPEPTTACNFDPTTSSAGFDMVDPDYRLAAGDVFIDDTSGPTDRDVFLPLSVDVPAAITGLTVILDYDPAVVTPFDLALDGQAAFTPNVGTSVSQSAPGQLLIAVWATNDGDTLLPGDPGVFQILGEIAFHLADGVVFRIDGWNPESEFGGFNFRATIVDTLFNDHHPELLSGEGEFARGDANSDNVYDISDPVFTLEALFSGGAPIECEDAADANNDGAVDVADPVYSLLFLFAGGPAPPTPYPGCGQDVGGLDNLGCEFSPCAP